jgi:uncharacterized protein YraI
MKRILLTAAIAGASLAAATTAFAGEGYVTGNVSLRAGPDSGYPVVIGLRAGTPVMIEGCVDGWSWCDVSLGDDRGWVSGAYLQEEYDGRRVLVRDYGVRIGIPVVSFVFGDYWDHYYRGRSWYGNRDRYSRVQPRYYHGGSYGHSGGSYSHSGGSYSHGATYQDSHHETRPAYSTGTHNGSVATHGVTTQPSYQTQRTRSTSHSAPSYNGTTSQHQVPSASHMQQGGGNRTAPVERNTAQRSISGEQHSAAGQNRAAEAHAEKGTHGHESKSDSNNGGGRKDKDNKDGGGH